MVCRIRIKRFGKKVLQRKGKWATIACPKEKSHIEEMNVKKRLLIVRKQDSSLSTREARCNLPTGDVRIEQVNKFTDAGNLTQRSKAHWNSKRSISEISNILKDAKKSSFETRMLNLYVKSYLILFCEVSIIVYWILHKMKKSFEETYFILLTNAENIID